MRLILDTGAFIAFERGDLTVRARLTAARRLGMPLVTTVPVVAQVWRDGRRQARLSQLVTATDVRSPDTTAAKQAGELLRRTSTSDVVDALLTTVARSGDTVLTSDADDLRTLIAASGTRAAIVAV